MTDERREQIGSVASYMAAARGFEAKWQLHWQDANVFAADPIEPGQRKQVILDFFPYPSGAGLHVGHPLGYLATDALARFRRMQGYNVLHSMGFDSFGLPAEQYAIQTNRHPRETTAENVANMLKQLRLLGLGHDESRRFLTSEPEYYRWTQWIFLLLYESTWDVQAHWTDTLGRTVSGKAISAVEMKRMLAKGERWIGADGLPVASQASGARVAAPDEIDGVVDLARLARLEEIEVNWCPMLGTVLANEEVTADRRSERGDYPVYRRPLRQWTLRITCYADRLEQDLALLDWPRGISEMQRNWIGIRDGAEIAFALADHDETIVAFTTRPDTLYGVTFLALAADHPLARRHGEASVLDALATASEEGSAAAQVGQRGVRLPIDAIHPLTGKPLPVFAASYVLSGYGTGAVMGVPAHDQRDFDFALEAGIVIAPVIQPGLDWLIANAPVGAPSDALLEWYISNPETFVRAYDERGSMLDDSANPAELAGTDNAGGKAAILADLGARGIGKAVRSYRLRDWIFSRQRYWGEPFPIVYDAETGVAHPLADSELPVKLPPMEDFSPIAGEDPDMPVRTPLGKATQWLEVWGRLGADGRVTLAESGAPGAKRYTRDSNTMPNWAGSCWYYLRYFDPADDTSFVSPEAERFWSGGQGAVGAVDLYVGGAEHAVLHLLYARFWHKVLYDRGLVSTPEPFAKLFSQGMITADAYHDSRGFYVDPINVTLTKVGKTEVAHDTRNGDPLTIVAGKMGKRYKNGVPPEDVAVRHSVDAYRCYMLFLGPLDSTTPWREEPIVGMDRFLASVWQMANGALLDTIDPDVDRIVHRTIRDVTADMESLRFNTALASLMKLNNALSSQTGGPARQHVEVLVRLLAPFAPHLAEELYDTRFDKQPGATTVAKVAWPSFDEEKTVYARRNLVVQINGKVRAQSAVDADADQAAIEQVARSEPMVARYLAEGTVRKVIHVAKGESVLLNFVVT